MTAFETIQNIVLYMTAHAALLSIATEGIKLVALAFDKPLPKPIKVLIPLALGISSLGVVQWVIRAMGLVDIVCERPDDCVYEIMLAASIWWAGAGLGALGIYAVVRLVWVDIIQALKNKMDKWSKS